VFARRFIGKAYCKHEALLCLHLKVDPRTLLPESNLPWVHPSYAISTDAERATEPSMKQTPDEHSAECNGRTDAHSLYARLHSVILISFKARNTYEIYFDANKRYS